MGDGCKLALIAEQRHALILQEIDRNASISIAEMEKRLNVTRETLRRDIASLDRRNLLRQVRGGAVSVAVAVGRIETSVEERVKINPAGKEVIAHIAADLISDNSTVIIDSGTTTQTTANLLAQKSGLTVFTNDILIAVRLLKTAREMHLIGGLLGPDEHSTQGHDAIEMMSRYPADFALIGVGGLSAEHHFTDFSRDAVQLRDTMIAAANTAIILVDHTKFGKVGSVQLRKGGHAKYVVSDVQPPEAILRLLDNHNSTMLTQVARDGETARSAPGRDAVVA